MIPSALTRGALNETIEIPKLLGIMQAFIPSKVHFRHSAPTWILAGRQHECDDVSTLDLIAAWMWTCAVWGCWNDPLKDKQATVANVTPQRVKNFHRGLSNEVYLFCMNCSDVWSAVTLNWGVTLLWGWAGYDIAACRITGRTLVTFVTCRFWVTFQGGN